VAGVSVSYFPDSNLGMRTGYRATKYCVIFLSPSMKMLFIMLKQTGQYSILSFDAT